MGRLSRLPGGSGGSSGGECRRIAVSAAVRRHSRRYLGTDRRHDLGQ